jgi:hypothetical protein
MVELCLLFLNHCSSLCRGAAQANLHIDTIVISMVRRTDVIVGIVYQITSSGLERRRSPNEQLVFLYTKLATRCPGVLSCVPNLTYDTHRSMGALKLCRLLQTN